MYTTEKGRRMFDNIQKFILHLLTSNVGGIILLVHGLRFQVDLGFSVSPLSPLHMISINVFTSSFPAFGLLREKAKSDIMRRAPHDKSDFFILQVMVDMIAYGSIIGTCTLLTFAFLVDRLEKGQLGFNCNREYSGSCDRVIRS